MSDYNPTSRLALRTRALRKGFEIETDTERVLLARKGEGAWIHVLFSKTGSVTRASAGSGYGKWLHTWTTDKLNQAMSWLDTAKDAE